jgi:5-oxoprolinase (ATP-hydrolysing)
MPPDAKCLLEEGVVIAPMYLVKKGKPKWDEIEKLFISSKYPTRSINENIADLNGALASVLEGEKRLKLMAEEFGIDEVIKYMGEIKAYGNQCLTKKFPSLDKQYAATEYLDDGSLLKINISINNRKMLIDFDGSGEIHHGNMNATRAIVHSVAIYVLRVLANEDIPLNEGLLESVTINIPTCMLNPVFGGDDSQNPAVVGGNTEISQRLTDTLLKALGLVACSQGTMNNLLFGNENFGHYETICGGTGAGNGFHGSSGVHQHMTNTRITDPEIMELNYPVTVKSFSLRSGSGGKGKWNGGNGVVRELVFKEQVSFTILSQHRNYAPFGMHGGEEGKKGMQYIIRSDGSEESLKGIDKAELQAGDTVIVKTPGGGGWGRYNEQ